MPSRSQKCIPKDVAGPTLMVWVDVNVCRGALDPLISAFEREFEELTFEMIFAFL